MNVLFTADVHVTKKRLKDVLDFLELCKNIIKEKSIDLFIVGGDLWNSMIPNTQGSGFVDIVRELKEIKDLCNVSLLYGTPSHEPNGSLDFAETFGIRVHSTPALEHYDEGDILYIPEPRRSNFIAENPTAISEAINNYLTNFCMDFSPDVMIYHGEMDNAYMDNGRACESDYKLSKAMIDLSGAKLVLAGHIHTPQKPYNNAYYVGSPVPCSFGETHAGSVITFTLKDHQVSNIERVPTNAPRFKAIELEDANQIDKVYKMNLENYHVKVTIPLSAGQKLACNTNKIVQEIKARTKALTAQVKVFVHKEVSVRSKEIAKANTVTDKLKIYGEVNEIEITPSVMEKAKTFEDNLLINYTFPSKSLELVSLSLRGAKGIKGKEEIFIDFSKYEDGLVALIGENGCGKTTLLEMASPFPCLLTRGGALKNHFYLKDSHKIVVYKDEKGKYYKFSILLAAHVDSGLVKYFAETSDDGENWKPVKECTGNLDDYKNYVESLFGNVSLYLRTAFFTKGKTKGTPDIASASKGERIELLSQLLGTENLIALHSMAKDKIKEIKETLLSYKDVDTQYKQYEEDAGILKQELSSIEKDLSDVVSQLDYLQKNDLPKARKIAQDFNEKFAGKSNPIDLKAECKERIEGYESLIERLTEHLRMNSYYKDHEAQIKAYFDNKVVMDQLYKKNNKRTVVRDNRYNEMQTAQDYYEEQKEEFSNYQSKIDNLNNHLENLEAKTHQVIDTCPTCGAKLSKKKIAELNAENDKTNDEINEIKNAISTITSKANELKSVVKDARSKYNEAKRKYEEVNEEVKDLSFQYAVLLEEMEASEDLYEPYNNYILVDSSKLDEDILSARMNLKSAKDILTSLECEDYVDVNKELEDLEAKEKELNANVLSLSMDKATKETKYEYACNKLDELQKQKDSIDTLTQEYDEYSILEKAFSNSGIQALELESAAPSIAELTNQILKESYGDKFTVAFSTLKQGRSKLVDDFSINVTNNETGWTTPIELLSEGEKIWIMQSLYYAFSLIRMEKTGFSFKVRFVDESDGALDSDMRLKYVKMIESAHKAGNARLTIMITHSQEVKDIVSQVISLS